MKPIHFASFFLAVAAATSMSFGQTLPGPKNTLLIEAESFTDFGGWEIDQQYMDQMGSPVLIAHGIGKPVKDATTTITFPAAGTYRVFVRTRNWVAPWTTEHAPGRFQLLFDGKALSPDLWQDEKSIAGYPVENGVVVCRKGGNLLTKKEYGDFIFRFEFKLPPGGNNGVGIRAKGVDADAAYNGMEIQILDNSAEQYKSLQPYQAHGSIYGVVPAKRNAEKNDYQKKLGEWNYQEITAKGSKIKVVLNGETIVDADISEFKTKPTIDGREHTGMHREKGFIGFLGHGDPLEFRNIRIKSLD
jgi:hypothetical protein